MDGTAAFGGDLFGRDPPSGCGTVGEITPDYRSRSKAVLTDERRCPHGAVSVIRPSWKFLTLIGQAVIIHSELLMMILVLYPAILAPMVSHANFC